MTRRPSWEFKQDDAKPSQEDDKEVIKNALGELHVGKKLITVDEYLNLPKDEKRKYDENYNVISKGIKIYKNKYRNSPGNNIEIEWEKVKKMWLLYKIAEKIKKREKQKHAKTAVLKTKADVQVLKTKADVQEFKQPSDAEDIKGFDDLEENAKEKAKKRLANFKELKLDIKKKNLIEINEELKKGDSYSEGIEAAIRDLKDEGTWVREVRDKFNELPEELNKRKKILEEQERKIKEETKKKVKYYFNQLNANNDYTEKKITEYEKAAIADITPLGEKYEKLIGEKIQDVLNKEIGELRILIKKKKAEAEKKTGGRKRKKKKKKSLKKKKKSLKKKKKSLKKRRKV